MRNFRTNIFFNKKIRNTLLLMTILGFSLIFLLAQNNFKSSTSENPRETQVNSSSDDVPLFGGVENPLNITDYGNLYDYNKEVNVDNQQETNISYYLDDNHNWKASQINLSVNDIQDTRNWVNNSGFKAPNIYRVYVTGVETNHPYNQPHNPSSIIDTIGPIAHNPTYMRVHFTEIAFERYYDYLYVQDGSGNNYLITDVNGTNPIYNVYSPWIPGDTIQLTYRADNSVQYYGYKVDYYEYVNASSNYDINSENWGFNYAENGASGTNVYGAGECGNVTGMYVGLYGEYNDYYVFDYTEGAFSELYQNITIPRGSVQDAYISFDYNVPFGLKSNDNYIYFKINNELVYSRGMRDVINSGKNIWHSTGKIYMDLWVNNSAIFEDLLSEQNLNISVGIMSGSSVQLTNFQEAYQNIVWFDNVTLVVTSSANSTQSDIDLKVNGLNLSDNDWGSSNKILVNVWDRNPIWLNFSTESPDLTFNLDTIIYGYHETQSTIGQTTNGGISYEILENGTIIWKFTHNFYMPALYTDFSFTIFKPENWNFTSALDPTLQSRPYEYGNEGDAILQINKDNALYPGWWTFKATSPNFLNISNTKLVGDTDLTFFTGESTVIKTQVNYSNQIPSDLEQTSVNLTIYDPNNNEWFSESSTPLSNGTVFFSKVYFDASNTTGGEYEYTLFWSNGTSLGGLNSSFFVVHDSSLSLLKPNDAISDLITDAFVGDIIPVRIQFFDSENNDSISGATILYNWTNLGVPEIKNFTEAALGIYETILYTSDLGSNGFYEILIQASKVGFENYNLTLQINLGEATTLQRLQSDYNIEMHANSTIKFKYYSRLDGEGIDGAHVELNITNPVLYFIKNTNGGFYDIEFNTSFINNIGIYQLNFNFSAPSYEPQTHIYQFRIVEQSINITSYINNQNIDENSIIEVDYMQQLNVSAKAKAIIDNEFLSGGNFTWIVDSYQQSLNEDGNFWYNASVMINPSIYSTGLNLIEIKFEMNEYQTEFFYFQLLVHEQPVDLSVSINSQAISKNEIVETMYMENFTVSVRAFATLEKVNINGALITWQGGNQNQALIEAGSWYNLTIQVVPSNYTPGLNSIAIQFIKDNYQTEVFSFQLLVHEQSIELSCYANSEEFLDNELIEAMFKQTITFSLNAYGTVDLNYISGAQVYWESDSYSNGFIESGDNWYNLSITFTASNFTSGINSVSIKFEKENYTTTYFSFQLLLREQSVALNASINSQPIPAEGALIEVMFKENVTISAQAFAMGESIYLSGGNISLISGSFHSDFVEVIPTWFTINFIIDGAYFDSGINTVSIKFEQENYTVSYFSFQFFITAETVNLSLYTESHEILSNNLINVTYNDEFSLSLRAMANAEKIYLNGGNATLVIGNYNQEFTENGYWYNITVVCDPDNFDLGINTVYVSFIHPNYTSSKFYFQILVNQIEINVKTIDFQDSIERYSGDSVLIRINLTESITTNIIENATIRYTWEFGLGNFEYTGMGIYEAKLSLPENIKGSYKVTLIILTNDILHKAKQTSFIVVISPKELPNYLLWIIIAGAAIVIGILGALSIRSYVILPRRRKKERELLSKTQNFKDLENIQAIVLMHRYSGVPLYSKSYSILEKQKKELFAGFVQAITSIGEEIAGKRANEEETKASNIQNLFELDFKYFHCVICDQNDLRIVVVLTEKASENLKNAIINLATGITLNLNELIEHWDGALDTFESKIPPILRQYLDLYYKEPFVLNSVEYISELRKEVELTKMEVRVLNTVYSMAKSKKSFLLDYITETVHEENKDKIIEAIESLISNKIFLPTSQ